MVVEACEIKGLLGRSSDKVVQILAKVMGSLIVFSSQLLHRIVWLFCAKIFLDRELLYILMVPSVCFVVYSEVDRLIIFLPQLICSSGVV
jgi:hypothetical protein